MSPTNEPTQTAVGLLERARRLGLWTEASDAPAPGTPLEGVETGGKSLGGSDLPPGFCWGSIDDRWLVLRIPVGDAQAMLAGAWIGEGSPPVGGGGRAIEAYTRGAAERVLSDLAASAVDLRALEVWQNNVDTFTRELDQAYESLSLIYRLGRAMAQFQEPTVFIRAAVEELRQLLGFRWAAVALGDHGKELGTLASRQWWCDASDDAGAGLAALTALTRNILREHDSGVYRAECEALGAEQVLQPIKCGGRLVGWLALGHKFPGMTPDDHGVTSIDTQAAEAVAGCVSNVLESMRLYQQQDRTFVGTLRALSRALDAKDRYTRGHSERVAWLGQALTRAAGLGEHLASRVHLAGILHDIGKIGVRDAVLCKPGRLTDEEFDAIKAHPRIGYEILKGIPAVEDALPGVLHHHERYDGRGYPDGLSGESIPLMARILALADSFDAMSSNRAYRRARSREEVLDEILRCGGEQFDPQLAEVFVAMDFTGFDLLIERHRSERADEQESVGTAEEAA